MPTAAGAVRREHVESWLAERRDKVAPASLSLQYRALVQFWEWAVDEDEIERSPMDKMKAPRVPDKPVPVVGADDFRKLLRAAEGKGFNERRDTALLLTLYDTGVRLGQLVGMRLEDVDVRARLAYVTGKGGHTRAVRFGAKTAVALDRYLRLRRGHRRAAEDALWLGQDGPLGDSGGGADHRAALSGGGPAAAPCASVPTHLRPWMADGRRGSERPNAPCRLAIAADARALRRVCGRVARESQLPKPRGPAVKTRHRVRARDSFNSGKLHEFAGRHPDVISPGTVVRGTEFWSDDPVVLASPAMFVPADVPGESMASEAESSLEQGDDDDWLAICVAVEQWREREPNRGERMPKDEALAESGLSRDRFDRALRWHGVTDARRLVAKVIADRSNRG